MPHATVNVEPADGSFIGWDILTVAFFLKSTFSF